MKVLILGGTGAMGKHLVDILAAEGNEVIVSSRKRHEDERDNVTFRQGNAKEDKNFLRSLLAEKFDVIVDFMVYTLEQFTSRIDILLRSCGQYIFISSARVYADSSSPITEESPRLLDVCEDEVYLATNEYALAKAREENILFDRNREQRGWTIIRPSLTYSETRLQLGVYEKENWLYRALHGRSIVFSRDLMERYYTMTIGDDVARGIASLMGQESAYGEAFHIVGSKSYQWKDYLNSYLDILEEVWGWRPNVCLTELCTNLSLPGAKYQVLYGRYFSRHFDNSKIARYVDVDSFVDPLEGLQDCLVKFLRHPEFENINWAIEARIDQAACERTPLREISSIRQKISYLLHRYS